jgi:hypothetical protein
MTAQTDVHRTGDTVTGRFAFTLPALPLDEVKKPVFAYVGVADLALEQAKELPQVVRTLPAQVKGLREGVESRVAKATESANELYAALAVRGERLVTRIRRQPATEAALAEGKEAVKKAEAAAVAATRSAKATGRAVEGAAATLG